MLKEDVLFWVLDDVVGRLKWAEGFRAVSGYVAPLLTYSSLEAARLLASENMELDKLQKSLRHWQIRDAEYQGLLEELQDLPKNATHDDLVLEGRATAQNCH